MEIFEFHINGSRLTLEAKCEVEQHRAGKIEWNTFAWMCIYKYISVYVRLCVCAFVRLFISTVSACARINLPANVREAETDRNKNCMYRTKNIKEHFSHSSHTHLCILCMYGSEASTPYSEHRTRTSHSKHVSVRIECSR